MRLSAWDLTIERGGRRLFAGLSFEIAAGAALIVTGPNGAGKSSLLRALSGFLPVQSGGVALEGGDAEKTIGEQAHYLGHADGVKGALTAGENLAFSAAMLGGDSSRAAQRASLARVGLAHAIDFPARLLSAGQGGAWRSLAFSSPIARSGCSTSRQPRSTPPLKAPLRRSRKRTCRAAGSFWLPPTPRWGSTAHAS